MRERIGPHSRVRTRQISLFPLRTAYPAGFRTRMSSGSLSRATDRVQTPIRDLVPVPRRAPWSVNPAGGDRARGCRPLAVVNRIVERDGGGPVAALHRPLVPRKSRAALLIAFQRLRSARAAPISALSWANASSPASLR